MLQSGQLTAETLLPRLATELNKLYNSGGEINTLTANWNRLVNSVQLFATESAKSADGVSLMNSALKTLTTLVNFVNVGLTSLVEYTKASATAFYEFIRLVSFSRSFDDFKKNVDAAFSTAQQRITESADAVFGLDRSLAKLGATAGEAAKNTEAVADAGKSAAASATEQAASAVVLVEQLRAIDELQKQGIINEAQAIENKKALTAAYQETLPVIEKTKEEVSALQKGLSSYARSAKTAAELDYVQATAMRELRGNAAALGAVMAEVSRRRTQLAEETKKSVFQELEHVRADAKGAKSSFDLALAMVRLIEQKKKLNQLFKEGVISQREYNTQIQEVENTTEQVTQQQQQQIETQKGVQDGNKGIADSTQKAGERVKVFNEVITDTSTVMDKMIAHLKFWQDEMDGLSESARNAFDSMLETINRAGGAMVTSFDASARAAQDNSAEIASLNRQIDHMRTAYAQATGDVNRWMIAVETAGLVVKRSFLAQEDAASRLEERLGSLNGLTEDQAKSIEQALVSYNLLDKARLDGIRAQVDDLRRATEALDQSALATLTSLQNELDRLNGNLLAIENRQYEQKRLELLEQINAAQEAGDALAVQRLKESLALLKKIHEIKVANLKADQAAAQASGTTATTTRKRFGDKSSSTSETSVSASGNIETTVILDGKAIARSIQPYVSEFGKLSG